MKLGTNRRLVLLVACLFTLSISGCVSYQPTQSGFLSDYAQLQKDPIHLNYGLGRQRALSHNISAANASAIDSYYIEPVVWMVDESSRGGRDPRRKEDLSSTLERALRDQLGKLRPIVDKPGPRTARVRSAITGVELSRPYLNLLLSTPAIYTAGVFGAIFCGIALPISCVVPIFIVPMPIFPVFNGGGFVEAEVVGPDGKQISAVTVASAGGGLDVIGFYSRARHARQAMRRAAWELRETLETK